MKTIAGAASLACLKRSRTRDAPTPTIASTNSEADREKNAASASPATARARSVLPVPGRAVEQDAARDAGAEPRVALRVLEEVDDFGELLLGLVDAGHVVERDPHLPTAALLDAAGGRPAEGPEHAATAPAQLTAGEPHQAADEQQRRREAEEEAEPERSARVRRLCVDHDVLARRAAGSARRVSMNVGTCVLNLSISRGLASPGGSYFALLLQVAVDRVLARGDLLHVAGLHLLEEERLVGHLRAVLGPSRHEREQEVEGEEPEEDSRNAPAARKHRRLGLLLRTPAAARRLDVPSRRVASVASRPLRRRCGGCVGHRGDY